MTTGRNTENTDNLPALLPQWYDGHRRVMPWRALPGQVADPYKVWLSEIMLQQTTVAAVGPFFTKFLGLWPSVHELAAAELDDVLHAWAGLGYYARARNLHKCARVVAAEHNGRFPDTEDALVQLPGIGPYTAAAIAAAIGTAIVGRAVAVVAASRWRAVATSVIATSVVATSVVATSVIVAPIASSWRGSVTAASTRFWCLATVTFCP